MGPGFVRLLAYMLWAQLWARAYGLGPRPVPALSLIEPKHLKSNEVIQDLVNGLIGVAVVDLQRDDAVLVHDRVQRCRRRRRRKWSAAPSGSSGPISTSGSGEERRGRVREEVEAAAVGRGQGPAVMEESRVTRRRRVEVEARRPDVGRRPAAGFRHCGVTLSMSCSGNSIRSRSFDSFWNRIRLFC